jgi:uncharacterized protein (DUF983 family)
MTEFAGSFEREERAPGQAMWRGFKGLCPHCGRGRLFRAFLKVVDHCAVCREELHHHRADDAPAYFVIVVVGHIVVPLSMLVEAAFEPATWVHFILWMPLSLALSAVLLQPFKGAIVGWQWANRMHGFDPAADHPL